MVFRYRGFHVRLSDPPRLPAYAEVFDPMDPCLPPMVFLAPRSLDHVIRQACTCVDLIVEREGAIVRRGLLNG